jgi:hypothetical protein
MATASARKGTRSEGGSAAFTGREGSAVSAFARDGSGACLLEPQNTARANSGTPDFHRLTQIEISLGKGLIKDFVNFLPHEASQPSDNP